MSSLKAYKYRLYPNKKQADTLQWTLEWARELYNAALQERRDAYEIRIKRHPDYYDGASRKQLTQEHAITYYDQAKQLPAIKEIREEYQQIHSQVLQDVLRKVDKAFKAFFARCHRGETPGYPRSFRKAEKKLAAFQQSLARKTRGSHRRKKAVKRVAKVHRKVRHQRADVLHKASRKLVNAYGVIVFEELQPAKMSKRAKPKQDENGTYLPNGASAKSGLNKSIQDAGWTQFVQYCTYKAANAGRTVAHVNPRYTSQRCSGCGTVKKKELSERWHSCECGTELDRDHNAAINILRLGRSLQAGA